MSPRSRTSLALLACVAIADFAPGCGGRSGLDVLLDGREDAGDSGFPTRADAGRDARRDTSPPPPIEGGTHPDATQPGTDGGRDTGAPPDAAPPIDARRDSSAADVCVPQMCIPWTCADTPWTNPLGGPAPDGCGNEIDCGTCECVYPGLAASCNGAVTMPPNVWLDIACCGSAGCLPETCEELGISCGRVPDGCGDVLSCGRCNADGTCPMGGKAGACAPCVPQTCASQGFDCGSQGDGCGGVLECGSCDPCVPCFSGVCAGVFVSDCVPATCDGLGIECGAAGDGCGAVLECGTCETPLTCARGVCGPSCL